MRRWEEESPCAYVLKGNPQISLEKDRSSGYWGLISYGVGIYAPVQVSKDLEEAKVTAVGYVREILIEKRALIDSMVRDLEGLA